jgi:hypothetical protein
MPFATIRTILLAGMVTATASPSLAASPPVESLTAADVGIDDLFPDAAIELQRVDELLYGVKIKRLGDLRPEKRSGQDAFYWPAAIAQAVRCAAVHAGRTARATGALLQEPEDVAEGTFFVVLLHPLIAVPSFWKSPSFRPGAKVHYSDLRYEYAEQRSKAAHSCPLITR